jgi:hypothetical protein
MHCGWRGRADAIPERSAEAGSVMAVQQVTGFEVTPGERDTLLGAIGMVKEAADQMGVAMQVRGVTAGPNVGNIAAAFTFEDWEALAVFSETNAGITQPVLEVLRSEKPAARVTVNVIRMELLPGDADVNEAAPFSSALLFDPGTGNPGQALEELGGTRDVFESLGAESRIWSPANGPDVGRVAIVSGFDNLAGWARFRERLTEHTAATPLPIASLGADGTIKVSGIVQTSLIEV